MTEMFLGLADYQNQRWPTNSLSSAFELVDKTAMSEIKPTKASRRNALYDKLHRYTVFSLMGIGLVTAGLLGYNLYLFKKGQQFFLFCFYLIRLLCQVSWILVSEGVPLLINKYRKKIEEQVELKQREAEYLEYLKRTEQQVPKK